MTSEKFWLTGIPCLTHSNCISNDFIGTENDGNLISDEQKLAELFNEHYINIVERSSGKNS